MASIETRRIREASSGKIPTTSVRRAISRLKRSSGLVDLILGQCSAREIVEGEHIGLGVLEQRGDLRQSALELADGVTQPAAGLIAVGRGEDGPDDRAE